MHKNSYSKMKSFKMKYLDPNENLEILDVGSLDYHGDFNYRSIFNEENWHYTGLDIEKGKNVDIVVTDIYNWFEIEDNSYDVIISGQFFEHLEFFWLIMIQIERVLKPGGYICIITPSAGPKHGGNMLNCYRFQEDGLKALAKYVDFEVIYAEVDERSEVGPWFDGCLIARKKSLNDNLNNNTIEKRMDNLEDKLDSILKSLK